MLQPTDEQIRESLRVFTAAPIQVRTGVVVALEDADVPTWVTVKPAGEPNMNKVALKAGIDGFVDGVIEIPALNSSVLIGLKGNSDEQPFILKCSEVSKVVINGGANGGVFNVGEMFTELQKFSDRVTKIENALKNAPTGATDGGAAYKLAIVNFLNMNTIEEDWDKEELVDTKVIH